MIKQDRVDSNVIQLLHYLYQSYDQHRTQLLNHPNILHHFFGRPINQSTQLSIAMNKANTELVTTNVTVNVKIDLEYHYLMMVSLQNKYISVYQKYQEILNSNRILVPFHPSTSTRIDTIKKILQDLDTISILHWTFTHQEDWVDANKKPPYRFNNILKVHFYGAIFLQKQDRLDAKLVQFAIIIKDQLSTSTLYYLQQMRIHLLWINKRSNIESTVIKFIDKIKKSKRYIFWSNGTIKLNQKYSHLDIFFSDYIYNQKNMLKMKRDIVLDNSDTDSMTDNLVAENTYGIIGDVSDIINNLYIFSDGK